MYAVCVHVRVKSEFRDQFLAASLENARGTRQEPGNVRFDVLQQADDLDGFLLYEVYRDEEGMKAHKQTPHYAKWAEGVGPWMAEPRKGVKYTGHFVPAA